MQVVNNNYRTPLALCSLDIRKWSAIGAVGTAEAVFIGGM